MTHWDSPKSWCCAIAVVALIALGTQPFALAQQGESKGENFSAKPPAQLFASDCTGGGCHKSPQGLAKAQGIGLAGFLREHYTNSRESAAAMAAYLTKLPSGPEPREARTPRTGKTGTAPAPASGTGWFESSPSPAKPAPNEARTSHQRPTARPSHTAARPEEPAPVATQRHGAETGGPLLPRPAPAANASHKRQPAGAATAAAPAPAPAAPPAAAAPAPALAPAPAVAATPEPATAAAAPASKPAAKHQYDIFD